MTNAHTLSRRAVRVRGRATTADQSGQATSSPKRKLVLSAIVTDGIVEMFKSGHVPHTRAPSVRRGVMNKRNQAILDRYAKRIKGHTLMVDAPFQDQEVLLDVVQRVEDLKSVVRRLSSDLKVLQAENALTVSGLESSAHDRGEQVQVRVSRFSGRIAPDRNKAKTVSPETLENYADNRTDYYLKKFGGN